MEQKKVIDSVLEKDLQDIVADLERQGATVTKEKNKDGSWKVIAINDEPLPEAEPWWDTKDER